LATSWRRGFRCSVIRVASTRPIGSDNAGGLR
jgi:hypothetical protein